MAVRFPFAEERAVQYVAKDKSRANGQRRQD